MRVIVPNWDDDNDVSGRSPLTPKETALGALHDMRTRLARGEQEMARLSSQLCRVVDDIALTYLRIAELEREVRGTYGPDEA